MGGGLSRPGGWGQGHPRPMGHTAPVPALQPASGTLRFPHLRQNEPDLRRGVPRPQAHMALAGHTAALGGTGETLASHAAPLSASQGTRGAWTVIWTLLWSREEGPCSMESGLGGRLESGLSPAPRRRQETADGAAWRTDGPPPRAAASNFGCRRLRALFFYSMFI